MRRAKWLSVALRAPLRVGLMCGALLVWPKIPNSKLVIYVHTTGRLYMKPVAKYFQISEEEFRIAIGDREQGFVEGVPRALKFAWAMHTVHNHNSHRQFQKLLDMQQCPSNETTNCLQDS